MPSEFSDAPELLEHHDPNRLDHYIEVSRVLPPPAGRYGKSKIKGKKGVACCGFRVRK